MDVPTRGHFFGLTETKLAVFCHLAQVSAYIEAMSDRSRDLSPSALIEFRAQNARSFRDEVVLSMEATSLSEPDFVRQVPWREGGRPLSVLPAAGVFGANASGKSNLLKVMDDMQNHVLFSFRHGRPGGGMPRHPFLLDERSKAQPSRYQVDIVVKGVLHRYGFAIDDDRIVEEWAYRYPKGRAALLFHRDADGVNLGAAARSRGRAVLEILRPNALFLSTAASANHPVLLPLYQWFERNLSLAESGNRSSRIAFTVGMLDSDRDRRAVLHLLRAADLGITDVRKAEVEPTERERLRLFLSYTHIARDGEEPEEEHTLNSEAFAGVKFIHSGAVDGFEVDNEDESSGTITWFGLIGPVLGALASGATLLADELDASLHPGLVQELLRVFQDPETNTRCAQLIFNSYDMELLGDASGSRPLGRDQIWFTEKLNDGATRLYPLTDFEPRKQEATGKRYRQNYYGARPIIFIGDTDAAAELVTAGDG